MGQPGQKMSDEVIEQIHLLRKQGWTQRKIANHLDLNQSTISRTLNEKRNLGDGQDAGGPQQLTGERGIVIAVINRAKIDFMSSHKKQRVDAAHFFLSSQYRHYMELLELPPRWLPDGVDRAELKVITARK